MENKEQGRILVVDDEPDIGQLLSRYLIAKGYHCAIASSGEAALNMLETDKYHLVLADMIMPGISGLDLLATTKNLYPDVAVIIVTGVDETETGVRAIELGAYGYIIKPFDRSDILLKVENALESRRLAALASDRSNGSNGSRYQ